MFRLAIRYYRRDIKGSLGLYTRKSQVERVLVLLVESGCLYSLLWVRPTTCLLPASPSPSNQAVYLAFLLTAGTGGSTVTNYVGTAIHSISVRDFWPTG